MVTPSRSVTPLRAVSASSSAVMRGAVAMLLPQVPPSSLCHTTTSSGWRVVTRCSLRVRTTSTAPMTPTLQS